MKIGSHSKLGYNPIKARARKWEHGISLIEVMAASAIVALSLIAMVSSWLYMIQASVVTDDRGAAYECARMVLERALANGYVNNTDFPPSLGYTDTQLAESSPLPGNSSSSWSSPSLFLSDGGYRFYNDNLVELSDGTAAPAGAHFAVQTQMFPANGSDKDGNLNAPSGRSDLQLMTIIVTVYSVDTQGNIGAQELTKLATCITEGGT
jgi:Tfp pilus assembly protein PilW